MIKYSMLQGTPDQARSGPAGWARKSLKQPWELETGPVSFPAHPLQDYHFTMADLGLCPQSTDILRSKIGGKVNNMGARAP